MSDPQRLPVALSADRTSRLGRAAGEHGPDRAAGVTPPGGRSARVPASLPVGAAAGRPDSTGARRREAAATARRAGSRAKAALRRGLRAAFRVAGGADAMALAEGSARTAEEVERQLGALRETVAGTSLNLHDLELVRTNLGLLSGEVGQIHRRLDQLGWALAPGTGWAGAGARVAELRESVNALSRQVRSLAAEQPAGISTADGGQPALGPATGESAERGAASRRHAPFDYVGFERRFRGDPQQLLARLADRYGDVLAGRSPVVDIGCGRGELLEVLAGQGLDVIGVEPEPGMAADARARGLTVHQQTAGEYLAGVPEASLGAVISTHVVEHLALDDLLELIELSARKLRPGGVFIAETPNPSTLVVLGNSYILDPTHVWPLHPSLLAFLCESAGFRDIELRFHEPAAGYHLATVDDPSAPAWVDVLNDDLRRLNDVLFGAQEYAVVATTAPAAGLGPAPEPVA